MRRDRRVNKISGIILQRITMNRIKTKFFTNDIELDLTEEETVSIAVLTEKAIWKEAIDENFLGGFKNKILKQIDTYDKLDKEYDNALYNKGENPRQFPFDSFFDEELSGLINKMQIVILDALGIMDRENYYLDLGEINELRKTIEMEAEIDIENLRKNNPDLFL